MKDKVKLTVLGFSFNQNKTGAYGLVLAEEGGIRRLMVVVGTPEAQSIAFQLQGTSPPRPLTHDLLCNILNEFRISVIKINIYKYSDGVFYSKIFIKSGLYITEVESRTSDAVGIALRMNSPIYTSEEIMQELGVVFDNDESQIEKDTYNNDNLNLPLDYSLLEIKELEAMLVNAIETEDYELASLIRDEINKRTNI